MNDRSRARRLSFNAPVVLGFCGVCLLAMLLKALTGGRTDALLFSVYRCRLADPMAWVRFVGHVFGHADWGHLLNNLMYILILGPMLEEKYGAARLALVMLVTALVIGLFTFLFLPGTALRGASGIVFAMILLSSITRAEEGAIPVTFLLVAVLYIGQQVWQGITLNDNVSQLGHILGGAVGAAMGFALNRRRA